MPDPTTLSEKNRAKLDGIVQKMISNKESEDDINFVVNDFKNKYSEKKNPVSSTSKDTKSELAPKVGSLDGKNTQGFPEIDMNSVAPGNGVQPDYTVGETKKKPLQKPAILDTKKEDNSFFDYLKENLDTGLATVSKSIYDTPGLIYDAAASITNPIFKAMGVSEDRLASSDKLAKDLGFVNIPSEILKEKIKVSNKKIDEYAAKNGGDALTALENGNYSGAAKLVAGTTAQSLPIMIAAMASGGEYTALTAIGVSTASTKNAELKESNPEMKLGTRVTNAATAGLIEAVTGHLFTGASGAVMKKILADKGVEVGSKIISKSFTSTLQRVIEKNPLVGALGEVVEETAVEFGNQANDIASGIRTEFDIHAIKNAGLSATGMGGINTVGVYGAKGYIKAKDYLQIKSVNKEIFKLQNELSNDNLSPENKNIIGGRIDRLLSENKKLLGGELEKLNSLPIETKKELNAINSDFEGIKNKVEEINDDASLSPDVRKSMLDELKVRAESAHKRKSEILSTNDNLIIKSDFSDFNGVEPDFNIEKESVNSLPLKEQETLKKQVMEALVTELNPDGKKNITITNEQVVERANKIYKANEELETPTPEAQPQAEVQKPSEAEKVDESNNNQISNPSENTGLDEKTIDIPNPKQIKNTDVSEEQKMQFGAGYKDYDFKKENVSTDKIKITEQPSLSERQELVDDIKKNGITEPIVVEYDNESDSYYVKNGNHRAAIAKELGIKEVPTIIAEYKNTSQEVSPVEDVVAPSVENKIQSWVDKWEELKKSDDVKELDLFYNKVKVALNGYAQVKDVVKEFEGLKSDIEKYAKERKEPNEATPPTNTPADGNVRIGDKPNDAQGKNNEAQPAIDTKPSEGEVKITTKKVKSVKDGEYDVDFDEKGNVVEIRSPKDGRKIEKFVEIKVKPSKQNPTGKILSKNANYAKIEADAYGELTNNQQNAIEKEAQKVVDEKIRAFEPNDEYELALKYVAEGGKVKLSSAKSETGEKNAKAMKWAAGFNKEADLPSIENVAEKLMPYDSNLEESKIREALIDIYSTFENQNAVKEHLLEVYEENNTKKEQQELHAFLGSLSEKDFAIYQAIQAEEGYFSELSEKEVEEYYNQKLDEYEQGQQEYARAETANQGAKDIAKGNEAEVGGENKNGGNQNRYPEGNNDGGGIGEVSNEQNRNNKLARERVQYEKITPKNAPKKLSHIIKDVANGLKSHVIYSRSKRSNTLGSYNPRNTLVRITKAGDIDTVAHELGHLLDDKMNILGTIPAADKAKIDAQLKWYSDRGGSNPPAKYNAAQKAEYLQREGLAEFIRSYIANPSQTKILAPELLAHFEKTIDPKTQTVLTKFSEDYLDFANASGIEKTLSNIEEIDLPNKNKFIEWIKGFRQGDDKLTFTKIDKFYAEMANSNHFGIKAFKALLNIQGKTDLKSHENFEIISRVFLGINGKLENVFSTGMINAKNEKLKSEGGVFDKDNKGRTVYKDGTAMNVKWLIDGLDTTTEESLKKDMGDVIAMAVAERTIEYAKKFERSDNLTGIGGSVETDLTTAVTTLNEFKDLEKTDKAKFDRIQEGVKRYRQMADATLQYAADKGRISKEQLEQIKQGNEYYVALNRNKELEPGEDLFSSFNTGTNGIGAAKEIIKKSKGGTATIENPYLSLLKNMNNIIKEADRNEVMLSFVEPLISTRNMGEGEPIDLSKIGFIANEGDAETIKVFRDGKLEKWKFDKDIYSSLKNIESIASNPIFTFLSKPSQLIRWTVTHNPVFYARNIMKDTQARMIVSNDHSSFKDMIHNSGDKELFELFGGSQAGHLHTSKESYAKTMQGTIKEITKKGGIVINPMKWGEKYVKFLQTGENLNRIAEFNNSYKVAREKGMSDYDAGLYAAFQARDLMDFAVAGHTMREINKIVVFSNAGVQSLRKASKSLKKDPAGFAYRTALYSVIPSVAFAVLRNAMGDDEEYEDLPDNQRDMFFNFKTAVTGDAWVSIPKPYELGLFSAYVDRGISKIRGNDEAFEGVTGTTMKLLMPFDESSFLGGLKPLIETKMNRDTYTDRSIVPEWESGKLLELRKGTDKASLIGQKTSKLFKQAGMSVDPRNIDHILKGYGTYFANQGMAVSDLAKKDRSQLNFWITKTGFAKDIPTYNAKSVKKATDLAIELGKINSGRMKGMRNDIEAFYSETDIKKRKELLNTIYKKSKEITDYYEKEKVKTLDKISKEKE